MTKLFSDKYWLEKEKEYLSKKVRKVFLKKGKKEVCLIGDLDDHEFKLLSNIGYKIKRVSEDISYTGYEKVTDTIWACFCKEKCLHSHLITKCPVCGTKIVNRNDNVINFLDENDYDNIIVVNFDQRIEVVKTKYELGPFTKGE